MSEQHSVSNLLQQLQSGDSQAARWIWERVRQRLIHAARTQLRSLPRTAIDEEDVAIVAFDAFLRGVKDRRFERLEDREDLWQVLFMLTERRAVDVLRAELNEKRGGGRIRGESVFAKLIAESSTGTGIAQVQDPDPATVDGFTEHVRELIEELPDELLKKIAIGKMEGYTNPELATRLGISLRAVERKLRLIRKRWDDASPR